MFAGSEKVATFATAFEKNGRFFQKSKMLRVRGFEADEAARRFRSKAKF